MNKSHLLSDNVLDAHYEAVEANKKEVRDKQAKTLGKMTKAELRIEARSQAFLAHDAAERAKQVDVDFDALRLEADRIDKELTKWRKLAEIRLDQIVLLRVEVDVAIEQIADAFSQKQQSYTKVSVGKTSDGVKLNVVASAILPGVRSHGL